MNENSDANSTPGPARPRRLLRWALIALAWAGTLVAVFYVEENWRGARAAESLKRQLASTGGRLDPGAFIPPPVADGQNFAMTPFFAPLYDFLPGTQKPRDEAASNRVRNFAKDFHMEQFRLDSGMGGWETGRKVELTDPATILEDLGQYAPVIDELRSASRRPHARFNVRYDEENPWAILIPHLAVVKRLSQILTVRAEAELALGQSEQALQDIQLALHLADSIKDEPLLISHMVRIAILRIVMQPVWEGLADRKWSEPQLAALQARLEQIDLVASLKFALDGERAWGSTTIQRVRENRIALRTLFSGGNPGDAVLWQAEAEKALQAGPRGWFDQELLSYNRLFQDLIGPGFDAGARRIDPKAMAAKQKDLDATLADNSSLITRHQVLARILLPAVGKACERFASAQTVMDEAILACALERHRLAGGQFPEQLDALIPHFIARIPHDVITGGPLRYRRTEDGHIVLYSVGWNQTDDGGTIAMVSGNSSKPDPNQGDWVWQYPAKP